MVQTHSEGQTVPVVHNLREWFELSRMAAKSASDISGVLADVGEYDSYLRRRSGRPALAITVARARSHRERRYADAPFKPAAFFAYSDIAWCGFLDGRASFHCPVAHAFYFWQIGIKSQELRAGLAGAR